MSGNLSQNYDIFLVTISVFIFESAQCEWLNRAMRIGSAMRLRDTVIDDVCRDLKR